jgi:hypothetical protein
MLLTAIHRPTVYTHHNFSSILLKYLNTYYDVVSHGRAVSIAKGYRLDNREDRIHVLVGSRIFLLHIIQTG